MFAALSTIKENRTRFSTYFKKSKKSPAGDFLPPPLPLSADSETPRLSAGEADGGAVAGVGGRGMNPGLQRAGECPRQTGARWGAANRRQPICSFESFKENRPQTVFILLLSRRPQTAESPCTPARSRACISARKPRSVKGSRGGDFFGRSPARPKKYYPVP